MLAEALELESEDRAKARGDFLDLVQQCEGTNHQKLRDEGNEKGVTGHFAWKLLQSTRPSDLTDFVIPAMRLCGELLRFTKASGEHYNEDDGLGLDFKFRIVLEAVLECPFAICFAFVDNPGYRYDLQNYQIRFAFGVLYNAGDTYNWNVEHEQLYQAPDPANYQHLHDRNYGSVVMDEIITKQRATNMTPDQVRGFVLSDAFKAIAIVAQWDRKELGYYKYRVTYEGLAVDALGAWKRICFALLTFAFGTNATPGDATWVAAVATLGGRPNCHNFLSSQLKVITNDMSLDEMINHVDTIENRVLHLRNNLLVTDIGGNRWFLPAGEWGVSGDLHQLMLDTYNDELAQQEFRLVDSNNKDATVQNLLAASTANQPPRAFLLWLAPAADTAAADTAAAAAAAAQHEAPPEPERPSRGVKRRADTTLNEEPVVKRPTQNGSAGQHNDTTQNKETRMAALAAALRQPGWGSNPKQK